ncbi:single-stranded DNA-binding protein [Intrasporangium sp.]|uniref:single-stranded DNA-binding protein n=1 Tax=Intrasporangium sp. TaxID=1925024 RepID=UPI0032216583
MNEIKVTVHGNVVTDPTPRAARNGSVYTTFRVATTPYRRTADGSYADLGTSFYSVIAFDTVAANAAVSVRKGQPVIIEGNLSTKTYTDRDGVSHSSVEVEAHHIGHDLRWGRASFERVSRAAALGADRTADEEVRRSVAALVTAARPAGVDENGEIHDVAVPGPPPPALVGPASGYPDADRRAPAGPAPAGPAADDPDADDPDADRPGFGDPTPGDPETDDYELADAV